MSPWLIFLVALGLDFAFGDPSWAWHPVRLIGRLVLAAEALARRRGGSLRRRGVGIVLLVIAVTWLLSMALLEALVWMDGRSGARGYLVGLGAAVLLKSSFAIRDLLQHAKIVHQELAAGDLTRARLAVGRIVGRDVSSLDERGVRRACLESVAESLGDAVVAPLFFAMLAGPAWAMVYRALNTMDSMIGYKDEKYRELGWAAARLDDAANWVPARLAAALTVPAAWALGLDGGAAWRTAVIDGPRQPSPNAGWPEGAFAGALGVELGGPVTYRGKNSVKATLGLPLKPLDAMASQKSLQLYLYVSVGMVALAALVSTGLSRIL